MQSTNQDCSIVIGVEKINLCDQPIAEGSSFDFSVGLEKRSLSSSSDERKNEKTEKRNSPDTLPSQTSSTAVCSSMTSSVDRSTRSFPATVSPERPVHDLHQVTWKSDSCLMSEDYDDDVDDMSLASGYSYSTYDTTATSESVQDIISRLQSETDRRRRRLRRRRARRSQEGKNSDMLQKYNTSASAPIDPKLGIMVDIKE